MKTFKLQFECDNDLFTDYLQSTVADALLALSKRVRQQTLTPNHDHRIMDNNGNTIGHFCYVVEEAR